MEEQIIGVMREHEAGAKAAELARKHDVSEATIYAWKAKSRGMSVSEADVSGRLKMRTARSSGCWPSHTGQRRPE
jgi:putative transposase